MRFSEVRPCILGPASIGCMLFKGATFGKPLLKIDNTYGADENDALPLSYFSPKLTIANQL